MPAKVELQQGITKFHLNNFQIIQGWALMMKLIDRQVRTKLGLTLHSYTGGCHIFKYMDGI